MSVGFGFSVGDFISALELVATVVDALREAGDASRRYRELIRQLDGLESVLLRVKRVELDESQHAEHVALQQAASQCQQTVNEFWQKIKKYQPMLGSTGSSRLKENWMKIRWAVCKKEDINAFKSDVAAHTESIQLLLTTIQMSRANLLERKNEQRSLSLAGRIQAAYFECMNKISAVFEATSAQMNVQVFQVVLNIQNLITHIPAQVERQQPVYLIDALGRHSPFHLEFIRSAEALTAVLQANFSKTGEARMKIGRGEFVIQNSITKRDINISDDWDKCFYPGQRVEMSVVFQRRWQAGSSCPGCGMVCYGSAEADVQW
ncbi:hypothetical protein D0Z07_1460 [Hyphodiscus hymeniophilus]|uniref:Fungal N-terminal domain-containing protein n=1 Tax=Hyphodiscus hymeniophilus TaxID=353542 RepID=A0A9P6VPB5_9HELO|nr:hypothetical protein D0Z07_1460 [Hyphodiscus hymeniophilus]